MSFFDKQPLPQPGPKSKSKTSLTVPSPTQLKPAEVLERVTRLQRNLETVLKVGKSIGIFLEQHLTADEKLLLEIDEASLEGRIKELLSVEQELLHDHAQQLDKQTASLEKASQLIKEAQRLGGEALIESIRGGPQGSRLQEIDRLRRESLNELDSARYDLHGDSHSEAGPARETDDERDEAEAAFLRSKKKPG